VLTEGNYICVLPFAQARPHSLEVIVQGDLTHDLGVIICQSPGNVNGKWVSLAVHRHGG
jgi:hypothetical protein